MGKDRRNSEKREEETVKAENIIAECSNGAVHRRDEVRILEIYIPFTISAILTPFPPISTEYPSLSSLLAINLLRNRPDQPSPRASIIAWTSVRTFPKPQQAPSPSLLAAQNHAYTSAAGIASTCKNVHGTVPRFERGGRLVREFPHIYALDSYMYAWKYRVVIEDLEIQPPARVNFALSH